MIMGKAKSFRVSLKVASVQPRKKANHRTIKKRQGIGNGDMLYLFDNELINFESKTAT